MPTRSERLRLLTCVAAVALLAAADARAQSAPAPAEPAAAPAAPAPAEPPAAMPTAPAPAAPMQPAAPGRGRTPGSQHRKVGVLIRMNFDFGGDKLTTVTWSDGSTTDLKAGQLMTFSGGLYYHPDAPYAVEGTLGYKFDSANGSNGTIGFTRVPLDVIASYANGRHRLGLGPTVHFAPKFSCDATGACLPTNFEIKFDTAIGGIAQYAYGIPLGPSSGVEIAVRYTKIEYKATGGSMDGSGGGFLLGAWF